MSCHISQLNSCCGVGMCEAACVQLICLALCVMDQFSSPSLTNICGRDWIKFLVKIGCGNASLVTMIINADDFEKLQLKRKNLMD